MCIVGKPNPNPKVSTLGPSDVAKGSSIYHHVKVTDFVATKAAIRVPRLVSREPACQGCHIPNEP